MELTLNDNTMSLLKKHPLSWALFVSLILHLGFLLFFSHWGNMVIFSTNDLTSPLNYKPIIFEIVDSYEQSQNPPEKADLFSDKDAMAKDLTRNSFDDASNPFSKGLADIKEIASLNDRTSSSQPNLSIVEHQDPLNHLKNNDYGNVPDRTSSKIKFDRSYLLKGGVVPSSNRSPQIYHQTNSGAEDFGSIQFNTYAWDFAPYMLELKNRIQNHIFPPPVFTQLGFGGKNVIRFRISSEGQLEKTEVLMGQGEKALIETGSYNDSLASYLSYWIGCCD